MTTPRIEVLPIEKAATTDPSNINKHTARGRKLVENSLQRRGAFRSIASAGKDADTPVVYAGNLTLETAAEAGFTEVVNVHVNGKQIVNVVRDDIAPGSAEAIALGLEDNESGKQSYNPDLDILAAMAADEGAILESMRQEDKVFNEMIERMLAEQNYSKKIEAPTYEPSGEKPDIKELYDNAKTNALIVDIQKSEIPEEEKAFLIIAAQRHTVLNFHKIADYYAHSGLEMQRLMEDSALVIIDFARAIELGYVVLTDELTELVRAEYGDE